MLPDGFDFRSFKDNTRFESFDDFVLEAGLSVLADDVFAHSD